MAADVKSRRSILIEDKDLSLSVPQHFLSDEDFRSDEFEYLEDFYYFCRNRVEEGISVLTRINDALRKYLINKELTKEEHSLLFDCQKHVNTLSLNESTGLFTNHLTNDSASYDQFPTIFEENAVIESLKKEINQCKAVIESQRLEISTFEKKIHNVELPLLDHDLIQLLLDQRHQKEYQPF